MGQGLRALTRFQLFVFDQPVIINYLSQESGLAPE
jgi:hypothetical protein